MASKENKAIAWLPQRSGSRTAINMLKRYGFKAYNNDGSRDDSLNGMWHFHDLEFPDYFKEYKIITSIRHPITWTLSLWAYDNFYPGFAEKDRITFSTYIEQGIKSSFELDGIVSILMNTNISYALRLEHLRDDLKKIPFYTENYLDIDYYIANNKNATPEIPRQKDCLLSDYRNFYTKKELDFVNQRYELFMNKFGYLPLD